MFLDLSRADVLCMLVFLALLVAWRSRRGAVVLVVGRARPARRAREREGRNMASLPATERASAPLRRKLIFFWYNKFGSQYNNIFIVQQLLEYFDKTTMPADTAL